MDKNYGLSAIMAICKFFGVYVNEEQLKHQYSLEEDSLTQVELLKIAKDIGFKAKCLDNCDMPFEKMPLPFVAQD